MAQIYGQYRPLIDSCLGVEPHKSFPHQFCFLSSPAVPAMEYCAGLNTCQRDMLDAICWESHHVSDRTPAGRGVSQGDSRGWKAGLRR